MSLKDENPTSPQNSQAKFGLTRWTLIVKAGGSSSPEARDSLNQLCQNYWYPLYAFIRRHEPNSHKAKDLTQSFFLHLLEKELVKKADRQKGRFRTFLLNCLTNFMKDEWRRESAQIRGGGLKTFSIDEIEAEEKYHTLPAHEPDSAKIFDRSWAVTLVAVAKEKLKQRYTEKEQLQVYQALEPYLTGETSRGFYAKVAAVLDKDENAVGVLLHRLRQDFGDSLRHEIAQTVVDPKDINDELRYLLEAWAGSSQTTLQV